MYPMLILPPSFISPETNPSIFSSLQALIIVLINVDLPAPFLPIIQILSPWYKLKSKSFNIFFSPSFIFSFLNFIISFPVFPLTSKSSDIFLASLGFSTVSILSILFSIALALLKKFSLSPILPKPLSFLAASSNLFISFCWLI